MSNYIPSETALYQRKYRINTDIINKCQNLVCKEQRAVSTVPLHMKYKLYNVCIPCKTNWEKSMKFCKCCGMTLRRSARRKREE